MAIDGILVVDKPTGITSFGVIRRLRRILDMRKMGHTGTLDPAASGVLVVCLGWATKAVPYLTADDKEYVATVTLGRETDTLDAEGETVAEAAVPSLTEGELEAHLGPFRGDIMQRPPNFSAIHINGQRAHKLARRGESVEIPERPVSIRELELLGFDGEHLQLRCAVSKGTYIRSLASDIGRTIGCGAHLSALRRTRAGALTLDQATTLDELAAADDPEAVAGARCLSIPAALSSLHRIDLDEENAWRFTNGMAQRLPDDAEEGPALVMRAKDGLFLGIGLIEQLAECTHVRPRKIFTSLDRL